jgi:hypothetical protein
MTHEHAIREQLMHVAAVRPTPPYPHPKPNPKPAGFSRALFSGGTAYGLGLCVNHRLGGDPDYCGHAHKQPVDERTGMPIG